ncbi:MAG: hypothetical protein L0Y54_00135 [Sporichthyaceae bacterium]|nr:hypothetical protein [Sporichthyaceae bacterium]
MGVAISGWLALTILSGLSTLSAHPAGNESVNQYLGVRVTPDRVVIDYVLDIAELPRFQMCGSSGGGCLLTEAEQAELALDECRYDLSLLRVTADGR